MKCTNCGIESSTVSAETGNCIECDPTLNGHNEERLFLSVGSCSMSGLTVRDWFAGMALQGYKANPATGSSIPYDELAEICYIEAGAMLEARKAVNHA